MCTPMQRQLCPARRRAALDTSLKGSAFTTFTRVEVCSCLSRKTDF